VKPAERSRIDIAAKGGSSQRGGSRRRVPAEPTSGEFPASIRSAGMWTRWSTSRSRSAASRS